MPQVLVSNDRLEQLKELREKFELKSIDAIIEWLLGSAFRINGGIFLGSGKEDRYAIWFNNVLSPMVSSCYMDMYIKEKKIILLHQCLKCGHMQVPMVKVGFSNDCDYICDGIHDEIEIQAAIDYLKALSLTCPCGEKMAIINIIVEPQ